MSRGGRRALSICAEPGCPEFATYRGYCDDHRRKPRGTGQRGSTHASRKRRAHVLVKAKRHCFYCNAPLLRRRS
jgi:hypothetical protein